MMNNEASASGMVPSKADKAPSSENSANSPAIARPDNANGKIQILKLKIILFILLIWSPDDCSSSISRNSLLGSVVTR